MYEQVRRLFPATDLGFFLWTAFTSETENQILELLEPDYIDGLTLLGGEPFEPENQQVLLPFLRRVREKFPDKSSKSIWSFTGFTLEELKREGSPSKM